LASLSIIKVILIQVYQVFVSLKNTKGLNGRFCLVIFSRAVAGATVFGFAGF
jgi:hypothetical protein